MAERNLFALTHLPAFRDYLTARGWTEQPTKGDYEFARFTHAEHIPLILYKRAHATMHATVQDKDYALVRRFLRSRHDEKGSDENVGVMRSARRMARRQG